MVFSSHLDSGSLNSKVTGPARSPEPPCASARNTVTSSQVDSNIGRDNVTSEVTQARHSVSTGWSPQASCMAEAWHIWGSGRTMGMVLSICCVPGKCKATWEVVPREVETLAKVCTAKKHLSVMSHH